MTKVDPDDRFHRLLRKGTTLLKQGNSSDALPYLKEAHTLEPENFDASLNLSGALILEGKFSKAVPILEWLSEERPDNPMVWTNLGAAYLGNPVLAVDRHQQKAINAFKRALEIDPEATSVAYNIGLIYRDRDQLEEAIHWFREAVKSDPHDRDAQRILARLTKEEE